MKRVLAAIAILALSLASVAPAEAEIVTMKDPEPKCSQRPALDVKRTTFNYGDDKFVWKAKMGALSKKRTRVFGRYTVRNSNGDDRYDVIVMTKFDKDGEKRVVGHWSNYVTEDYANKFTKGLTARWDWERRLIIFTLTTHLKGKRANAWAYSIAKGAQHGPPCGDYIWSGRIKRG
jgi:hypothetical protein